MIERGKLPDMSYEITVRDILSTRRMRADTSRTAATADTARSVRSVALGASLRDRERSKRHLRSMHSHLAASHRQAKLVAALGADVVRTDVPAHCECKQLPGYLREAALKRCESSVVDHHQLVHTSRVARAARPYEETAQELAEKALFVDRDKACTRAAKRPPMPVRSQPSLDTRPLRSARLSERIWKRFSGGGGTARGADSARAGRDSGRDGQGAAARHRSARGWHRPSCAGLIGGATAALSARASGAACTAQPPATKPEPQVDLDNEKLVEAIALDLLEDVPNAEKMAAVYSQHARSLLDA